VTVARAAGALTAAGSAALAARYQRATASADRTWAMPVERRLTDLGDVGEVSILPLVERLTARFPLRERFPGEAGVCYLIRAARSIRPSATRIAPCGSAGNCASASLPSGDPHTARSRCQEGGTNSSSRVRTRTSISSRMGRTASTPWPAGSSSCQSR
jgi:hypothetical protein